MNLNLPLRLLKIVSMILGIFLVSSCSPAGKAPPKAVKGVLDLREWDFQTDGNLHLDGEWEFYWKEFPIQLEEGILTLPKEKQDFIPVPQTWAGFKSKRLSNREEEFKSGLPGEGYATYRLKILLGKSFSPSFRINETCIGSTMYFNGKVIYQLGTIGMDRSTNLASRQNIQYLYFSEADSHSEIELVIPISNFHHARGGLWNSITMGKKDSILNLQMVNYFQSTFVSGILFIIGIYHLSLYYLHKNNKYTFYFALFCLLSFVRSMITGEKIFYFFFPNFSYELSLKIEYWSIYLGALFSFLFFPISSFNS